MGLILHTKFTVLFFEMACRSNFVSFSYRLAFLKLELKQYHRMQVDKLLYPLPAKP